LSYEDAGEQEVKNIARPVRVFRVMLEAGAATRTAVKATERFLRKHWRGGVFSLAGLALIAAVIVFGQHLSLRPPTTTASIPPARSPALTLPDKPSIAVLPFAHMVLGETYLYKRQYDQATAEAERAIALDPNSAFGYAALARIMDFSGKSAEAIGLAEKAMRLDPRNRDFYLFFEGFAFSQMGRYEEAIPIFKRHLAPYPNNWAAHAILVVDYTELGREDEARGETAEVLRISPEFSLDTWMQISPQKDQAWRKRLIADMRKAGVK